MEQGKEKEEGGEEGRDFSVQL